VIANPLSSSTGIWEKYLMALDEVTGRLERLVERNGPIAINDSTLLVTVKPAFAPAAQAGVARQVRKGLPGAPAVSAW
jgi:hypothetical protein